MEISVKADVKEAIKYLDRIQRKQVPFATHRALNDTARDVMYHIRKHDLPRYIHKPIGVTKRGILYRRSKSKRDLTAYVFIDDGTYGHSGVNVRKYLLPNIKGGSRALKRSEYLLRRKGILPQGKYLMPAKRYTNAAGNIKPGLMQMILSQMQAFNVAGFTANATPKSLAKKKYKFFAIPGSGIFTHRGKKIDPVLYFISQPHYRKRFPFGKLVDQHSRQLFPRYFRKHLKRALETAK